MKTKIIPLDRNRCNGGLGPIYCCGCGLFFDDHTKTNIAFYKCEAYSPCRLHKGKKGYRLLDRIAGNTLKTAVIVVLSVFLGLGGISYGVEPREAINVNKMVKAIYIAEGGRNAKKPFGVLSVPCEGFKACESICRNTVRNNIRRWKSTGMGEDFISFIGERYAPRSCSPLNANWIPNVRKIYTRLLRE
jgi:hypothetical protein